MGPVLRPKVFSVLVAVVERVESFDLTIDQPRSETKSIAVLIVVVVREERIDLSDDRPRSDTKSVHHSRSGYGARGELRCDGGWVPF
ncbi:hypothetical protein L484_003103 [Morus notabilis]|uniref:Uncharacterized protein n=1 Tax=Morus notabilis TaxID=981085 RepID=W9SRF8_9ROSA|nr:hypothetical protein L484_003103 [Morus notabilis]